jgi:hypothetical protein
MDPWVEVPASAGEIIVPVLMDLADYKALAGRSLSIGSHGYAQMWDRPHVRLLHRWIMGVPTGIGYSVIVDHINHDILDCRRGNLRVVSPTESNLNRRVVARALPIGVYLTRQGKFHAAIKRHRVITHLGTYTTVEEAEAAVSVAVLNYNSTRIPEQRKYV